MPYIPVSLALVFLNCILALFLFFKTNKSFLSLFYFLCICLLITFGVSNYLISLKLNNFLHFINDNASLFLFSVIPFFFLHFIVIYLDLTSILRSKITISAIYMTGLLTFLLIILNLIPKPDLAFDSVAGNGFVFFITWNALFFSMGNSYTFSFLKGVSEKSSDSVFFILGFGSLLFVLPGPLSEAILHLAFKESSDWYFFSSVIALVISVYFVFRNKAILSLYESLRIALESIDDMMLRMNKDFKIELVRGAYNKLSGFTSNELLGLYLDQIIEQKDILKAYRAKVADGKIKEAYFDLTIIKKNRDYKYMNFSFTPLFNQDSISGYVCMGRDISERRATEEELRKAHSSLELKVQKRTEELAKANDELQEDIVKRKKTERELILAKEKAEEANRLKFSLLANLSHELRTPMIGILGMAEILKNEVVKADHADYTNSIINSAQRLMTTLDKLMSLSQLESGSIEFNNRRLNISELAKDEIENFRQRADEKNLKLSVSIKNPDIQIFADERIFRQIVANLLDNAIKFTSKGEVIVETESVFDKGNLWAFVKVIDTGIGISKNNQELIFEEFRQGSEGNQRSFEGNGLGLTLVKKMLEMNKGSISVNSTEGKGSTFAVRFPGVLVDKEIDHNQHKKELEQVNHDPGENGALKEVLFVEDNSIQGKLTAKFLEGIIQIEFVEDAYSAIRKIQNKKYFAVFINTELPFGRTGTELMQEIRELPRYNKTPIIAVTRDLGSANKELIIKGFTNYLIKPFEKNELIKFVQSIL